MRDREDYLALGEHRHQALPGACIAGCSAARDASGLARSAFDGFVPWGRCFEFAGEPVGALRICPAIPNISGRGRFFAHSYTGAANSLAVYLLFLCRTYDGRHGAARLMKLATIDKAFSKVWITAGLLLDRMIGVVPAALFFLVSLPWIDFETVPGVNGVGIALAVVAVGTVLALVMAWFWRERLRALASQVRWTAIPWVAVWSLPTHLLFILAVGLVAMAVSPDTGMFEVLFVVSAANLLLVVPVSFAGAGFAEAGSLGLWLSLGTPVETAVVLSFIPYALRVIAAIQGAIWEVADGGIALLRTPE